MTVFDVYVNDRKACRAGVGRDGVLTAIVNWVKLTGAAAATASRMKTPAEESRLHVGGLRDDTHLAWCDRPLAMGDRVAIVVGAAGRADRPASRKRRDRRKELEEQRAYYRRLKRRFEPAARPPATRATADEATTRFLNVDLDIYSTSPLDPLVKAFGRSLLTLHVGKQGREYSAHLELGVSSDDPDMLIRRYVALVDRLPRSAKRLWTGARAREFNIGIQAAAHPHSFELGLKPETVRAVAGVRGRIGVTIYGAR